MLHLPPRPKRKMNERRALNEIKFAQRLKINYKQLLIHQIGCDSLCIVAVERWTILIMPIPVSLLLSFSSVCVSILKSRLNSSGVSLESLVVVIIISFLLETLH